LAYLIKKINIIAITVVGSNAPQKPAVIKRKIEDDLANKFNRPDIKVFAGADRPYINYQTELKDDEIFDSYNYKSTDYSKYLEEENKQQGSNTDIAARISNIASVKITEYVRLHEKKLNILALGPLTNLSLAVLIDSTIRDKFNKLYIAGGSYNNLGNSGNAAEYNFRSDPVAAKNVIFYYKNITMIPLEIEEQIIKGVDFKALSSNKEEFAPILELYTKLSQDEEETRTRHSFHGLISAIIAVDHSLVAAKHTRPVDVDIIGRFTRGALAIEKYDYLKSGKFNDIDIFEEVNVEAFKQTLVNILS
jgi:inosine-uridine nucleoside N-ribohydrolase